MFQTRWIVKGLKSIKKVEALEIKLTITFWFIFLNFIFTKNATWQKTISRFQMKNFLLRKVFISTLEPAFE